MKTKTSRITLIVLTLLLFITVVYWFYPKPIQTSTTSEVTIVEKGIEKGDLWIRGFDPNSRKHETIKMYVLKQKMWDSFQENKTYMLTYIEKDNEVRIQEIVTSK